MVLTSRNDKNNILEQKVLLRLVFSMCFTLLVPYQLPQVTSIQWNPDLAEIPGTAGLCILRGAPPSVNTHRLHFSEQSEALLADQRGPRVIEELDHHRVI